LPTPPRDWPARANPDAARGTATSSKATGPWRRCAISAWYRQQLVAGAATPAAHEL